MPAINQTGTRLTLTADEALSKFLLLTIDSDGEYAICGATDEPIAQCMDDYDLGVPAGGRLPSDGVWECKAAGTISAIMTKVYTAADGEVSATAADGARFVGYALATAAADDIIPVLPAALIGAINKQDLAAATYVAPSGGATQDAEARASLAQLAADFADLRASLVAGNVVTT